MQRDEFGGIVMDAPANDSQPAQQGQHRDEFGGLVLDSAPSQQKPSQYFAAHPNMDPQAVNSAYQQLQHPTGPAHATTPEQVLAQQSAANASQRSASGNFVAGALEPYQGLAGRFQKTVASVVSPVAPNAAQNIRLGAEQIEGYHPAEGSVPGIVGNLAGGLPFAFAGPVGAVGQGVNAGEMAYHNVEQQRAAGQQIGGMGATADVIGQATLAWLMTRIGQKNLTGPLPAKLVGALAPELKGVASQVAARLAASGVLEAGVQDVNGIVSNLITKLTGVNPQQDVMEGAGQNTLVGAGFGVAGRAIHEALPQHPQAPAEQAAPPVPSPEVMKTLVEEPSKTPILDRSLPKYRNHDGGQSYSGPINFEHPEDKAAYVATQPRAGKATAEASDFLKGKGYSDEQIQEHGQKVRSAVEQQTTPLRGEPASIARMAPEPQPTQGVINTDHLPEQQTGLRDHRDEALEQAGLKGAYVVKEGLEPYKEVLDVHKELTGQEAIPYAGGRGRGFRNGDRTFFRVDAPENQTPQGKREAIAHEAAHWLQDNNPKIIADIDKALPESMKKQAMDEYGRMYQGQEGKPLDPAKAEREAQALLIGRAFAKPSVARQVMGANPSAFIRAIDTVTNKLRTLTAGGRFTNQVIASLRQAREQASRLPGVELAEPRINRMSREVEPAANFLPEHNDRVRDEAREYTEAHGIPYQPDHTYAPVNVERAKQIAKDYDAATHNPADPKVQEAYTAFKKETLDQYNFLQKKGIKLEAWDKPGQPYANSAEMMADARDNKHLFFFTGGELPSDHPLAERAPGTPYTYNDVFRAVHDYFGHAKEGVGFGPRGEENAWRSHSQMYSDVARNAMTTETRGQNSWVNFGPHGEHNQASPTDTRYAEQKAALLNPEYAKAERDNGTEFLPGKQEEDESRLSELSRFATKEKNLDVVCTQCAKNVVDKFGGKIYGFWNEENPSATIAREGYDGHDFAVVNGRYLVDAWATHIETVPDAKPVYDLKNPADAALVRKLYGPRESWKLNDALSTPEQTEFLPSKEKDRERALKALPSTELRDEPANAEQTMFGKQPQKSGSINNDEVARILNERTQKLAGQAKARESEKLERAIAAGVPEAEYQLKQPNSGKDWYKGDIAKMEGSVQKMYPETKKPEYMTLFKTILGITSQGNNPNVNFKHADPIFGEYLKNGKIPVTQPNGINWPGTLGENYKLPLGRLQGMLEEMGVKGASKWLLSKHTVGEINQWSQDHGFNANVSGPKDAQVYGMEIFGPKIGTFILNQHGIQEKVTKDLWFSRTWNRWMGTMLENGEVVDAPRNDAERETMDKAVGILANKLGMEPMDVQATLWYYEQQLWKAHGAKAESGSYSKAAERVMSGDRYDYGSVAAGGKGTKLEATGEAADHASLFNGDGSGGSPSSKPEFLPGSEAVKSFAEEDVKPAIADIGERASRLWDGVKSLIAPQTRSEQAGKTARTLRETGAELAQRRDRLAAAFKDTKEYFDSLPQAETRAFIDQMEHGSQVSNPKLQPVADSLRAVLDDRLRQVQQLGTGKLQQFVLDYFPHLWDDPKKAGTVYREMLGKTPMEGAKSFLKNRTIQFFSDGISRGLEPVTENPVEAVMMRVREMDKYITAQRAFGELRSQGLVKKVAARSVFEQQKAGYEKINDSIATIFAQPNRRGGLSVAGYWMAPEPVANVINNHLSPGLRNSEKFGPAFRTYLGAGNVMNQVQLGLSGFHLSMTALDSATSKLGLSFKQAASGQFKEAGKSALSAASIIGPAISNVRNGNLILREWLHPGTTTPEVAQVVDAMKAAGGRIKMDDFYHTGMTDKMMEAFRKGNVIGGILRAPLAAIETSAKPLMEQVVPRMKMGVFMDMAKYELSQLKPGASRDEVRQAMSKAWDSVDNRMGELVYDNLFWNKAVKDLSMASVRSVGWNLGTIRELGGGVVDTASFVNKLIHGDIQRAEFTHRMAYTAAMPVMAGMVGGLLHYLLNGKAPEKLKDWYFPRTGEKDKEGHDVRLALPSYMKDVLEYGKDIRDAATSGDLTKLGRTAANKTHPLLNTLWDMLRNEDYYGHQIRNENHSLVQKLLDEAKFLGKNMVPFGTREVGKLADEGQGAKSILPLLGVVKARHDISNSPAENKAVELMKDRGLPKPSPAADVKEQGPKKPKAPLLERTVRHLDLNAAMKVWEEADAGERQRLGSIIASKIRNSNLPREDRIAYMKKFQNDWKALKAGPVVEEGQQ